MRKQIASWFGKKEHTFALILGGYLLFNCTLTHKMEWYGAMILWLIYHICHRLEKGFYGRNGYR